MMREFVKAFRAAIKKMRRLMAGVASTAMVAVRGVDGVISWVIQTVAGSPQCEVQEDLVDEPMATVEAPVATPTDIALERLGEIVLRAADEVLRHGEIRSGDVPTAIAVWLQNMDRSDLFEIVREDALTVGRHTAGVTWILGMSGDPLRGPEGPEDKKREEKRQAAKLERRNEEAAAARRRRETERAQAFEPSMLPRLAF